MESAEWRWRTDQASPSSTAAEGKAPILQYPVCLELMDDIIMGVGCYISGITNHLATQKEDL